MTVAELIEQLEDLPPTAEVRLATQPSWPLEYRTKAEVVSDPAVESVVYLAEGEQLGYLNGHWADKAWGSY